MLHLYLIDYFNQNSTGLTTYVSHLTKYLLEEKHVKLHLILVKASGYKQVIKTSEGGLVKYYVPHDPARLVNRKLDDQLGDFLAAETHSAEKVIFHFNWINHAPFAQILKKKINCFTILTKHCMPWRDLITAGYPLFRRLERQRSTASSAKYLDHALINEWVSYHSVDHIVCVTAFARHSLQSLLKVPIEKISVIPNGLHTKAGRIRDKNKLRKKYGFAEDEHLILFAGNLIDRKGIFDLVEAFNIVLKRKRNVRLVLAGDGDYRGILKLMKGNWLKLTMTGFLDKQTLYDFYQIADVGVIPSYVEQCSYTAIEMMHYGLPIVAADVDGLSELLGENRGFKIPLALGNEKACIPADKLADHILMAIDNKEIALGLAENARQYASKFLTSKKMMKQTLALYEQMFVSSSPEVRLSNPMKQLPLVSVVLPCNNGSKFLNHCLDSILRQSYSNFELIIIDDGSDDGSIDMINSYKDRRIVLLKNSSKTGIVASLNQGINRAKGKYIARIDSDDMMHPDRLQKQVEFLEQDENQPIGILGSNHYVIDAQGCIIGFKEYPVELEEIRTAILFHNPFSHPSMMMRRNIATEITYSSEYLHAEDYHLWFNILRKYRAANIPECLTYYRVHGQNVSSTQAKIQQESVADLLSDELEKLDIQHSVEELTMHIAISQGLGSRFFNNSDRLNSLDLWIEKVLEGQQKIYKHTDGHNKEMKSHIRRFYCGIPS